MLSEQQHLAPKLQSVLSQYPQRFRWISWMFYLDNCCINSVPFAQTVFFKSNCNTIHAYCFGGVIDFQMQSCKELNLHIFTDQSAAMWHGHHQCNCPGWLQQVCNTFFDLTLHPRNRPLLQRCKYRAHKRVCFPSSKKRRGSEEMRY